MAKLFFIFLAAVFFSCNDSAINEKHANNTAMPEEEKSLRSLVEEYPDSIVLTENLIEYFKENDNYGQAIAETEYALKRDSLNPRLLYIRAYLLSENADTLQAVKAWEKLVEADPQPKNVLSLGSMYALTKNPKAIALADTMLAAPKANLNIQAVFIKGLYYSSIGEKIKAIDFFDKCLALDYSYLFAYREKAICLYDLGKYADALKVLELSLTIKKTNEEAYYWMGRCYEKLGLRNEAIKSYEMAMQLAPDYIEAKDALAKISVKTP
jgi:tetratricopeptide (TPR) repeat protein